MKKLLLFVFGAAFILCESCTRHHHVVMAYDLDDTVKTLITPGMVSFEVNRPWSHQRTWGLMETRDDSLLGMGYVTQVKRGKINSIYRIGNMDTTFAMPNAHFSMQDSILRNGKNKKLEVIRVEPEPCLCEPGMGISFGGDSVTRNFVPPQKKVVEIPVEMLLDTTEAGLPVILAAHIDTVDTPLPNGEYSYRVAVRYSDKTSCDVFWLIRSEWRKDVLHTIYMPSAEHREYFRQAFAADSTDKRVVGLVVMKDYVEPKGVKKQPHDRRDRW